jgi:uncharacterized protein (DUF302 family)
MWLQRQLLLLVLLASIAVAQKEEQNYIDIFTSERNHAATVEFIIAAAEANGWALLGKSEMHKNLSRAGFDLPPITILNLCKPAYAGELLSDAAARHYSTMMPCRVSVYEDDDGTVKVALLNAAYAAQLYPEVDSRILLTAMAEIEAMLSGLSQ